MLTGFYKTKFAIIHEKNNISAKIAKTAQIIRYNIFDYSLLDVGVQNALDQSAFDEKMFFKRGGKYQWSKKDQELDW